MPVRTRFAPSPTGALHVGSVRTALFSYLFARHHGGAFVLRIEDTDRERSTEESTRAILEGLGWLGLAWDEGPYHQSERLALYRARAEALLAAGAVYRCWCTPEELEARRQAALAAGRRPAYDRTCRDRPAPPAFAHVPQILGLDKSRLSKRHGATSVLAYREMGYLPDAVVNYLSRLGWSHGDQELFSREELIAHFSLENVGKSAGIFNPEKLEWVNFQYMKATPSPALADLVAPFLERAGLPVPADRAWLARVVETLRERAKTLVELAEFCRFYLVDTITPDPKAAAKHLTPAVAPALADLTQRLAALSRWDTAAIEEAFQATLAAHGLKLGALAQPVRVAVTGGTGSPGIYEVLDGLGRGRPLARLAAAAPRS